MCHKKQLNFNNRASKNTRGSALVIAIFIIIVMSLLGSALVKMLSTSAETIVYEVFGTRAYNAAQVGIQWQIQQLFPLNNGAAVCNINDVSRPDLSTTKGLENCEIKKLSCTVLRIPVAPTLPATNFYTVTSTGVCNVNGVLTSRKLEVQAKSTI